jgi:hypothetical protein
MVVMSNGLGARPIGPNVAWRRSRASGRQAAVRS